MARAVSKLPKGTRISDYISLVSIGEMLPSGRVREIPIRTGRASAGRVAGRGERTTALHLSMPVEIAGSIRGGRHQTVLTMARAGQSFRRHIAS